MTQRQSFGILVSHALIALALITTTTVLGALGTLDASAVTAIFGAVLGFAGGAGIAQGAAIINGGTKPNLQLLAESDPATLAAYLTKQPREPGPATHTAEAPADVQR